MSCKKWRLAHVFPDRLESQKRLHGKLHALWWKVKLGEGSETVKHLSTNVISIRNLRGLLGDDIPTC